MCGSVRHGGGCCISNFKGLLSGACVGGMFSCAGLHTIGLRASLVGVHTKVCLSWSLPESSLEDVSFVSRTQTKLALNVSYDGTWCIHFIHYKNFQDTRLHG
uniref:Uncharacterized protein n=1 Tax=Triticum urartu TaxID=4572 RepID=A0A8R7UEL7_TRIUA